MGQQIVKQPNGKYSIYSSITGSVIGYDCTRKDLVDHYASEAADHAKQSTNKIIDKIESGGKPYYQFTVSWDEIKSTIPKEWLTQHQHQNNNQNPTNTKTPIN